MKDENRLSAKKKLRIRWQKQNEKLQKKTPIKKLQKKTQQN